MKSRAQQTLALDTSVNNVRFAHGKRLEGLQEMGIFTIRDLLLHYPFRYDDFSQVVKIVDATLGEKLAIMGTIHEAKARKTARGGYLFEATIVDDTGSLKAVWFNQRWLADTLKPGREVMLLGKVEHYGGFMNMASPLYTLITKEKTYAGDSQDVEASDFEEEGINPVGIVPVYSANSLISSNWIKRLVLESRRVVPDPIDPLPPRLRIKRRLVSRQIALHDIHTPKTREDLDTAHMRLAYEQVFWEQLRLQAAEVERIKGFEAYQHMIGDAVPQEIASLLPYELTNSQKQAVEEIYADMQSGKRMNRLLLGDVGSGKTVVALHALVGAAANGWQAVMMAPTEVLAQQYSHALGGYLESLGISWAVFTSSTKASQKLEIINGLSDGTCQVVFGTHALIEPQVQFNNLSLVVIDEQQRFGVDHRDALLRKSPGADFLSMTATPIPRSLALVIYGNTKVSKLENRPRKAHITTVSLDASVVYEAYEAVRRALEAGEQAYIVCPLISAPTQPEEEESYIDDLEAFVDEPYIAAAESELAHLQHSVFPDKRIALLNSRLKSEEKNRIMTDFKNGQIDILVSTTVIEVGVDVPNATVMMVLDADRFGLAQLHQLRGRVGRGDRDSKVYLVSKNPGDKARQRLRLLEKNSDGFILAEEDLLQRREGDITGIKQHGTNSLSLVNVIRDSKLIEAAHSDVMRILEEDPDLSQPQHLHVKYELSLLEDDLRN